MRRFVMIVLACALGLAAAFAFARVAILVRPCEGEALSCSITQAIGLIYTPVFSVIALVAFAVAIFWKGSPRALNVALLVPLVPFLLFVGYVKASAISVREWHEIRENDIQELLQIVGPICLTLVLPWALLRFATRFENEKK